MQNGPATFTAHISGPQQPPQRRFLLSASTSRTLLETFGISVIFWSVLFLLPTLVVRDLWFTGLVGPLCMLYYILRLRLQPHPWGCRHLLDATLALALGLLLGIMEGLFTYWISTRLPNARTSFVNIGAMLGFVGTFANWAVYVVGRPGVRLLIFWNRLRRRHLLWALTNSHVLLVAIVAGVCILLIDLLLIVLARTSPNDITSVFLVIPFTLLLLVPSAIAMLLIVPPVALFSYFVIRRATDRLRNLMFATSALRAGNYSVRVNVEGEDEVASLQRDFNSMATDLERTMRALQDERDRVAHLLQERRELIANVSHELRTPVATMRGYLETALMHWDEMSLPQLQHDMRVMEEEAIQLQARVEDLFMLARADVGMLKLQPAPTDARELVKRIVEARAPLAWRASRIEVLADIAPDLPEVMADSNRLAQAIQNLLHNGLRHTSPGGIVAIVITADEYEVIFQVKDTGEGIAPQDLPHIWERFYQTESARTRTGGGTGLGLALVKEWIESMHGSVSAESELGQGSCFTLRLPRAIESAYEQPTQPLRNLGKPATGQLSAPLIHKVILERSNTAPWSK